VEQVEKLPDRIALTGNSDGEDKKGGHLSYRELDEKSSRLAGLLIKKGVRVDNIVAIMMQRSLEMVIGILGILKSGGVYLPIDSSYPSARIDYLLKDSAAKITIGRPGEWKCGKAEEKDFPYDSSSLAYVIYTSGSTGNPKGVIVEHRAVVNLLYAMQKQCPFSPTDTYLLKTSCLFDVSVTELFGWFMGGGKLAVLEKGGEKDTELIFAWVERNKVTHINFVPSMFNIFIDHVTMENKNRLSGLKYLILAGEALFPVLVKKFKDLGTGISLENIYGPTEATVYSSRYSLSEWQGNGSIPIGKPLPNIKLYILNKYHYLQPVGIPGELCISGPGLARGYLNRPELTAEKFKFNKSYTCILYQTGDLARWLPDGNIEYLGRIDNQVKIRGFRIELGEIEEKLLKHRRVKAVVVTVIEKNNIPQLCAYIVLKNEEPEAVEKKPDAAEFRKYLTQGLPNYMIPAHFFQLEKIPLTPSGKVDIKKLQASTNLLSSGIEYVSPKSDIESTIVKVWQNLLGLEKIGIHDNFFDLGGNSLTIIRLNSRLKEVLPDKKDISVVTLFNHPTVSSLVNYLNRNEQDAANELKSLKNKPRSGSTHIEIAVIGMAGRFPGAKNIDEFWNNIKNGVESIRFFTREELKQLEVEADLITNPDYVPAKGVLANKEYFDSFFFGYTPIEAEIMDPQVRIFHECTWEALENAGYNPFNYDGAVGLYA
ncbi:MAG TPA: amino acid adenylation domain-containing protein, partial [Candidatus Kapabacteria bacterium]|nr:amino acid adenylation domain-containing protein [Candidatus Kapabacteria bacterium]